MSKGKDFELKLARLIRQKGFKAGRDSKSGGSWWQRSDLRTPDLPVHIEAKDQATIKVREWFAQAASGTYNRTPVVVFKADHEILACIRFNDLLDLYKEIADKKS